MPVEVKRKPRDKPPPYNRKASCIKNKNAPATSAKPTQEKRDNLTLHDWLTVFAYVDSHPSMGQAAIVQHFRTTKDALIFNQSTLSRKLKKRSELEERVHANPNALSSKHPRVVTQPDVERALVLWVRHMEEKRETVNAAMLCKKLKRFEKEFEVPEKEQLLGDCWVQSFCKA